MQKSNSGDQRIALEHCPACGGETLPEVERHDGQGERVPQLIIVADDRAHLYELFQQAFAYHETVRVLRDRRVTERRRQRSASDATDRRRSDRRSPATIDGLLHSLGWAIVPPGCPRSASGLCPLVLSGAGPGGSLLGAAGRSSMVDARPFASRHLLGVGVLLLTMTPGYLTARMNGAHEVPHVRHAPAGLREEVEGTPAVEDSPEVVGTPEVEGTSSSMDIDSLIRAVAARHGVSENLVAAIIEAESEFNPRAVSRTGACGLMQLMPQTAALLGVVDPFDPRENIEGGVRHLRSLMDRFNGNLPLVLAAYNAGERAVIGHGGVPPYRETRQYVKRILRRLDRDNAKTSDQGHRARKDVG